MLLSDEEVLSLADLKMVTVQNERLGELQARGKAEGLTEAGWAELLVLLHIYQTGQLRKSEGMAEAVRRNLQQPLITAPFLPAPAEVKVEARR